MIQKCSIAYHIYCNNKKFFLRENLSIYNLIFNTSFLNVYDMLCYGECNANTC